MKRFGRLFSYIAVGLGGFIFFLYIVFPYEVLKEVIAVRASRASGMNVQIGELGPAFPFGVRAENVVFSSHGSNKVKFRNARIKLGLFPLLLGRLKVNGLFTDEAGGYLEFMTSFSAFSLLGSSDLVLPKEIVIDGQKFLFGKIVDFLLKAQADAPDTNVLVKPWLESIDVDGKLDVDVNLSIDAGNLSNSEGQASISLHDAVLKSLNPNLAIQDQKFKKALIKAKLRNGELQFDKNSGFVSQDLTVTIEGKIKQEAQLEKSKLDISIAVQLKDALKDEFGIVVQAITKRENDGQVVIKIGNSVGKPSVQVL